MSRQAREMVGDWLMLVGAAALALSLFFTWSHQFSPAFWAAWRGTPALRGVPRDPTAWQVYSAADVLLALVAAGLVYVAFVGTRTARLLALIPAALALGFVVHALGVPPTNGANLAAGAGSNHASSGFGEVLALAALAAAIAGVGISFTAD